jgi:SsrA-binding protein
MVETNKVSKDGIRVLMTNRKARHLYHIEQTWEAGIELRGTEVKSLRQGGGSVIDSFGEVVGSEVWLNNLHIPPYDHGNRFNVESKRKRKLLLHAKEIRRIAGKASEKGHTLVPLKVYFSGQKVKVELALARGKKEYDKRDDIRERDSKMDMAREWKGRGRVKE